MAEGIKVYTTLDPNAQQVVENVMNDDSNFPTENIQSGVAVVDTKQVPFKPLVAVVNMVQNVAGIMPRT